MSYKVLIRNNATGEVVESTQPYEWDDGNLFWWSEGNFSCDCNRELQFCRAKDIDEPDRDANRCGEERFTVIKAILPDGTEVEIDGEELEKLGER